MQLLDVRNGIQHYLQLWAMFELRLRRTFVPAHNTEAHVWVLFTQSWRE